MVDRRNFLHAAAGLALAACSTHGKSAPPCRWTMASFTDVPGFAHRVLRIGSPSAVSIVLLHELQGLSDGTLALAQCLADHKLTVYVPLLFGSIGQESETRGFIQACLRGDFACSAASMTPPPVSGIEALCRRASELSGAPVGVVGMSLTGSMPLALLRDRTVGAAVLCQPTLPFSIVTRRPDDDQKTDLGVSGRDLADALKSDVSLLALHYAKDPGCPEERMQRLEDTFKDRVAIARIAGDRHSTLVGDFHGGAFADTVNYLKVRLQLDPGPKAMQVAKLRGAVACEITPGGRWRKV